MKHTGAATSLISKVADELVKLGDTEVDIEIKKHRERRSLDANAYFHVLVDKISKAMRLSAEEVKHRLVCDYGSEGVYVRLPMTANIESFGVKYYRLLGESKGSRKPCNDYLVYKPTHEMDRAEMARLIDGTVQEAKQLEIETRTPTELAEMMSLWEEK